MISASGHQDPPLTVAEKAQIALLVARMVGRCAKSETLPRRDLERKLERILDRARVRAEKEGVRL